MINHYLLAQWKLYCPIKESLYMLNCLVEKKVAVRKKKCTILSCSDVLKPKLNQKNTQEFKEKVFQSSSSFDRGHEISGRRKKMYDVFFHPSSHTNEEMGIFN